MLPDELVAFDLFRSVRPLVHCFREPAVYLKPISAKYMIPSTRGVQSTSLPVA